MITCTVIGELLQLTLLIPIEFEDLTTPPPATSGSDPTFTTTTSFLTTTGGEP